MNEQNPPRSDLAGPHAADPAVTSEGRSDPAATAAAISAHSDSYWRANLRVLAILMPLWFVASLALSVVFVVPLNRISLFGFPLGFWISQQGAIYVFILLIFVYARWMDRVDARHGEGEDR